MIGSASCCQVCRVTDEALVVKVLNRPSLFSFIFSLLLKELIFFLLFSQLSTRMNSTNFDDCQDPTKNRQKKKRKILYSCILQFYYMKVGFKGAFIARACFPDA